MGWEYTGLGRREYVARRPTEQRQTSRRRRFTGGFDGTSNVLAGKIFRDLPVTGTHAHSYVQAHASRADLPENRTINGVDVVEAALRWRYDLGYDDAANLHEGEFSAFCAYALANPAEFSALVDTYSTMETGLRNFITVALALKEAGFESKGVRIDSGDLAYLSKQARALFDATADEIAKGPKAEIGDCLRRVQVIASNDLNERVILSLREQNAKIDVYGIGTHLVTCQAQPALGCVYKLVEIDNEPCAPRAESKRRRPFSIISANAGAVLSKDAAAPRPRRGYSVEVLRGGGSRRRRGHDVDIPWRSSAKAGRGGGAAAITNRGGAAATTWIFRGDPPRKRVAVAPRP